MTHETTATICCIGSSIQTCSPSERIGASRTSFRRASGANRISVSRIPLTRARRCSRRSIKSLLQPSFSIHSAFLQRRLSRLATSAPPVLLPSIRLVKCLWASKRGCGRRPVSKAATRSTTALMEPIVTRCWALSTGYPSTRKPPSTSAQSAGFTSTARVTTLIQERLQFRGVRRSSSGQQAVTSCAISTASHR